MGIIHPAEGDVLPNIPEENRMMCISCGQCDAFCPTGALTRDNSRLRGETAWDGKTVTPELFTSYLKSRRSIRNYQSKPVDKKTIEAILDCARYAASGGNGQPVEWKVILDPQEVKKLGSLTIDWMKTLIGTSHPMSGYAPRLVAAWESGVDVIFRGAPHLIMAHIPKENPMAAIDGIIAVTHVDIAAPAFGVGTCWAGFLAIGAGNYPPLVKAFDLPEGRIMSYALMAGYPQFKPSFIPARKPLSIIWTE